MTNLAMQENITNTFNLRLGKELFSDPQRDRSNCIVVANHHDVTAGIDAGDLVRIDFTQNTIGSDGMYVVTLDDEWIGYRFFDHFSKLQIVDGDKPIIVTPDMLSRIKVVGKVKDIYRSTSKGGSHA